MEAITGTGHGATTSNTYFENLNESWNNSLCV
jgi:hypothetical protein